MENTVSSLDGMSELMKSLYREKDEGFELGEEFRGEDVSGLKTALESNKADKNVYKEKNNVLQDELVAKELEIAKSKGDTDKVKQIEQDKHRKALDEKDIKLKIAEKKNYDLTIGSEIQKIKGEFFKRDSSGIELMGWEKEVGINEDGSYSYGGFNTAKDFMDSTTIKERFAPYLLASRASGGGKSDTSIGGGPTAKPYTEMSKSERSVYMKNKYGD